MQTPSPRFTASTLARPARQARQADSGSTR